MKFRKMMSAMIQAVLFCAAGAMLGIADTAFAAADRVQAVVDETIRPLMTEKQIPGMAVGVVVDGKAHVFNYGVASKESGRPVTNATLFELGSVSKTFTATLASLAEVDKQLSLSDKVETYLPPLRGSDFGKVRLLDLGAHTVGGLPLQVPDDVHDEAELISYLKHWHAAHAPGTFRTYSNISIGTLGILTANRLQQDSTSLMEGRLFPGLGLKNTFIDVPAAREADYAQGYTAAGKPIRMKMEVVGREAYGVKSTAGDLLHFMQGNMKLIPLEASLQRAVTQTHTGYFQDGPMTQDLIWEQYPYPVALKTLLTGNGPAMLFKGMKVTEIRPPEAPRDDVWINKTGSTNGFSSYVAFVPAKRMGIVILANRSYPIEDRVAAAYRILTALDGAGQ
ncbi:class C beta-lactamase [Burkholderia gladioli]|uniref:class C beta-lactamase n=1 Tax=Burkholderia gladioli TaxID=28095 RepID=UPI0013F5F9BE|nr:class C beta-lactamase [Burkholderia gladioli]NHH83275.1 Beta-lactamase [Burkholderia gladioli]